MSNIFSLKPLYVNLYNVKTKNIKRIYLIGDVPKALKNELKSYEKSFPAIKNSTEIKKWYGKDFRRLLDLESHEIKGGDDLIPLDLFDSVSDISQEFEQPKTEEPEISFADMLENDTAESIQAPLILTLENDVSDNFVKMVTVENKIKHVKFQDLEFNFDVTIYPHDTITDLKNKLAVVTGILPFRQHLFSSLKNNIQPVHYNVTIGGYPANSDLRNQTSTETILNVPINKIYYENKTKIKIIAMDEFSILENYFGNISHELHLIDFYEYINNSNRTQLYNQVKNDSYYRDLVYYGFVVIYYPMFSVDSFLKYLEMGNEFLNIFSDYKLKLDTTKKMYDLQNIITNYYDEITMLENGTSHTKLTIEKFLSFSITTATLAVHRLSFEQDTIIYARNIFDSLETDRYVDMIKAYIKYDNQNGIVLQKKFNNSLEPDDFPEHLFYNSVTLRIWIPKFRYPMHLTIFNTGNYQVKTKWLEELNYTFDDIIKTCKLYVNPIIERINQLGNKVLFHNRSINLITKNNCKFTNLTCNIIWHQSITSAQFDIMKEQADDFRKARIFKSKAIDNNVLQYYFTKISHNYDPNRLIKLLQVSNLYSYLTDPAIKIKFETFFQKSHVITIDHRLSNVKVEITGIKDSEFPTFKKYMISFFGLYLSNCKKANCNSNFQELLDKKSKAPIKSLKLKDPELYNFKSTRKNTYSKLCQKPFQPLIFSDEEYTHLNKNMKNNSYLYWNFTKKTPAHYVCPNSKYPNLRFIIGKHPKNYCIPCCKKKAHDVEANEYVKRVYDSCTKTYTFSEGKRLIVNKNAYIASYGKDIEPERLSRLPEQSLEPIFYDIITGVDMKFGKDQECAGETGYYLYGIEQNSSDINNIGCAFVLIKVLNNISNYQALVNDVSIRLNKNEHIYKFLLNGKISEYCSSIKELISILKNPDADMIDLFPWNEFYMSVTFLLYNINIVLFEDMYHHVDLILPRMINDVNEYFIDGYKNLLLFKKEKNYYPIFYINPPIYYVNQTIDNKLFSNKSDIIQNLSTIIKNNLNMNRVKTDNNLVSGVYNYVSKHFNLFSVKSFCESKFAKPDDVIVEYYLNKNNLCYYVKLQNNVYLPITESYTSDFEKCKFDLPRSTKLEDILAFRRRYNDYVIQKSKDAGLVKLKNYDVKIPEMQVEPIIPFMQIEKWLVIAKKDEWMVHGFLCNDMHFYISPCHLDYANKHYKIDDKIVLLYDPLKVNAALLHGELQPAPNISNELYDYYLYQLFVLEFVKYLSHKRNEKIRTKLKKLIATADFNKNFIGFKNEMSKMISSDEDQTKLIYQINQAISSNKDKSEILTEIDSSVYNFDNHLLETMKELELPQVQKMLKSMSSQFVEIKSKRNIESINNIITSCKAEHCKNHKLYMNKQELDVYTEILAAEVVNPLKNKWVFSDIYLAKNIDPNLYIYNPSETITISLYNE